MAKLGAESYAKTMPLNSSPVISLTAYTVPTANFSSSRSPSCLATVALAGFMAANELSGGLLSKSRF